MSDRCVYQLLGLIALFRLDFHGSLLERRDSVLSRCLRIRETANDLLWRGFESCLAPIRKRQAATHADLIFGTCSTCPVVHSVFATDAHIPVSPSCCELFSLRVGTQASLGESMRRSFVPGGDVAHRVMSAVTLASVEFINARRTWKSLVTVRSPPKQ